MSDTAGGKAVNATLGTGMGRWATLALLAVVAATLASPVRPATATAGPCGDPATRPWCDTSLPADQRAGLLLAELTQDEKLKLLAGVGGSGHTGQTAAIDRVGLRGANLTDDGVGVKQGNATAVPIPMALAATFDPSMAGLHGGLIANEARAKGNDIILGPTVNLMRTPLGGRTFEAYGEDPYLISRTAVSWIEAAQSQGVIAEVKHFCCNNQEGQLGVLGQKNYVSADLDERTLREIYLPQFEAAIKEAHAGTVMCAYNRVNEDWACEHQHLLSDILKGDWGFQGAVVSDWQATHFTIPALRNGLDVEMPTPMDYSPTNVKLAIDTTLVTQAEVDDHVRRLLRTLFAFGFMDRPAYANDDSQIDQAGHAAVAQRIEESGITLLKNSGILPLGGGTSSIALVGPQADRFENGGNTDNVVPFTYTTPRQAITQRAGAGVSVVYNDGSNAAQAAAVAAAADVAVVFASDSEGEYKEKACASVDCTTGGKTRHQDALIATVAAANPNTVVVLETGDPVLTPWRDSVRGVVEAWYPGEEGGAALARVLFGDVDPGGRLPATFPQQEADMPTSGDPTKYPGATDVFYKEGVFAGYRWYDAHNLTPAFAFGAGLSYTTFQFDGLAIHPGGPGGVVATVTARVTNTGSRAGVAVPQLYLGLPSPSPSVPQPPRQLKGYSKLNLAAGQSQVVSFPLDQRAFSYWDVNSSDWRVAPGCYGVFVGSSSRELPLQGAIARGVNGCATTMQAAPGSPASSGQGLPNTSAGSVPWLPVPAALLGVAGWLGLRRRRRGGSLSAVAREARDPATPGLDAGLEGEPPQLPHRHPDRPEVDVQPLAPGPAGGVGSGQHLPRQAR
jgi:beta-glucosidase